MITLDDIDNNVSPMIWVDTSRRRIAELEAQVAALQAKLAQALAVCNDDLTRMQALTADVRQMENFRAQDHEQWNKLEDQMQALTAERDAAQKALGIVWNVYSLRRSYGFTDEEQVIVDAALAQARGKA